MKIGVLGGGQLGRMLALAGIPLGHQFRFWEPGADSPASDVGEIFNRPFEDSASAQEFVRGLDTITYEFENIPVALIDALGKLMPIAPGRKSLEISQDRLSEKTLFASLGMKCAPFAPVTSHDDIARINKADFSLPAILKTRRLGYDGKGQVNINSMAELAAGWKMVGEAPAILEERLSFDAELSLICVRSASGEKAYYPLVENRHTRGILSSSRVPSDLVSSSLQKSAEQFGSQLLEELGHVGVLTIEFFLCGEELLVNEIAPRVHNSGHWSIEGASTSQFENHIRAVTGAPLGDTQLRGHSVLVNLVGENPDPAPVQRLPGVHLHLYRKASRERRKIGHITVNRSHQDDARQSEKTVTGIIEPFQKF